MQTTTHSNLISFPPEVLKWLNDRTLTNDTIERFGLHWNGAEIVIPVRDTQGHLMFYKYRRSPFSEEGPKYRYEKGSGSALFNIHTLETATKDEPILITEGELDCIAVENIGIKSVTTTGGAGTFEQAWAERLKEFDNVIICFDNDKAGIKGAIYVQSLIPHASMLIIPEGKDVTDYLIKHSKQDFLLLKPERYPIPTDAEDSRDKKEVRKKIREFKDACNYVMEKRREMVQARLPVAHLDIINEYLSNRYALYNRAERSINRAPYKGDGNRVIAAKQVPITNFIQFNRQGYAPCVWHEEKTASMFYNKETKSKFANTVKCFGCGAMGDPIDVIMQMRQVEFGEAVNILLGGH